MNENEAYENKLQIFTPKRTKNIDRSIVEDFETVTITLLRLAGYSYNEIGKYFHKSTATLKRHVSKMYSKYPALRQWRNTR